MVEERSFSMEVKDELAHLLPAEECCQRMELAALLRATGRITLGGQGTISCALSTELPAVARKLIKLIRSEFKLQTEVMVGRRRKLRKNLSYLVRIPPQPGVLDMLKELGAVDEAGHLHEWGDLDLLQNDHCRRAYLRGTFLGTGWVSNPERQHHLEMTTTATDAADALGQLLFGYGIPIRMAYRKEAMVLYLKEAEHVIRFLSVVGAHQALLHYEEVRVVKEMKNRVNRQVNAETANLNKTVEAAARQVEALESLQARGGLAALSEPLRQLALLRINHPDASLKELGEMCTPPVGKSGINHRMRQLMKIAEAEDNA